MAHRPRSAPFISKPQIISKQGSQKLRQQIEYYFSLKNLITDHFLTNIINSSKGGWVDFQIIAAFNQIQHIFKHYFPRIGSGLKGLTMKTACEQSQLLQVNDSSVRRKNKSVTVDSFDNVLYFQGNIAVDEIKKILTQIKIDCSSFRLREGKMWYFIEFYQKSKEQVQQIYIELSKIPQIAERCRVLKGEQFKEAQKEYSQIVGIVPLETPISETQDKYKFPSNRIISYQEMAQFKINRKTRPIQPKGKHCQTRLPVMYINGKRALCHRKRRVSHEDLIQLQGLEPKKKSRGPEDARIYNYRKIQQKKQRKAKRRQEGRMQIEECRDRMMNEG